MMTTTTSGPRPWSDPLSPPLAHPLAHTLPRPVAFAFSGGGSHGAVHIGQLRALQEYGVRPDFLVGSSVGALNATVLAATPEACAADRLEALWRHVRARDIFCPLDAAVRQRRAVFGNDGLRRLVARHFPPDSAIEDLPIPLYVLATDSATRQQHMLDRGALAPALLASCAIPVVLPPVTIDGAHLIDGGIRHDLPLAEAFNLGAASVVAFPATRWPHPIGYRSSAPIDDHRVLLLDGAASPGTGWTFCRTRKLIDRGYRKTSTKLRTLGFTPHHGTQSPGRARDRCGDRHGTAANPPPVASTGKEALASPTPIPLPESR